MIYWVINGNFDLVRVTCIFKWLMFERGDREMAAKRALSAFPEDWGTYGKWLTAAYNSKIQGDLKTMALKGK